MVQGIVRATMLGLLGLGVLTVANIFEVAAAAAQSDQVRSACTSDYLSFCGQFDPDSQQTKTCMRRNQNRLSPACRKALAQAGYQK